MVRGSWLKAHGWGPGAGPGAAARGWVVGGWEGRGDGRRPQAVPSYEP